MKKSHEPSEGVNGRERPTPRLTRRELLRRGVVIGGTLLLSEHLAQGRTANPQRPRQVPAPLRFQGINYDTGTNYDASYAPVTRTIWERALLERDMKAVREGLRCNAVCIYGTDISRLVEAATVALAQGLEVWLQPRLMEASPKDRLEHLAEVAREAEGLRRHGKVTLNAGVELSLFMSGIIPGATSGERAAVLGDPARRNIPAYTQKLKAHLEDACSVARTHFGGPLTYSAGEWEWPDWAGFDVVGRSLYMSVHNEATYVTTLREVRAEARGKPVVITEFGCCTFRGAGDMGGMGWSIIDYSKAVPEIPEPYIRSEQEQADYLVKLLGIFEAEALDGAFIYDFSSPTSPYASNRKYDLDMASFALVRSLLGPNEREATRWEPKRAFHEVARIYGRQEKKR